MRPPAHRVPSPFPAALLAVLLLLSGCASREEKIQRVQAQAEAALFNNQPQQAIEVLREGLDRFPDANAIRIALSRVLANTEQWAQAVALLEEAVTLDPEQDELWVKIGEHRARLGESEAAVTAFENYLTNNASDFLAWKALALEYERMGKLTDAIKAASRWNALTPSAQPALKLGELYLASGNASQARSWFGQAAAYGGGGAAREALAELVQLETRLEQFQQASAWLDEYRKRYGPGDPDPRIHESKTVLDAWRKAREEIARAAAALEEERRQLALQQEAAPNDGLEEQSPNGQDTQIEEPQAASAEPPGAPAGSASGAPSDDSGAVEKPPEALFGDSQPVEERVRDPQPQQAAQPAEQGGARQQAVAAIESGDFARAVPQLWQLLGNNPDDPELWYQLSRAYFAQENWFDAEACILEARRRAPSDERIAAQFLKTLSKTQSVDEVIREGREIRQAFPGNADVALAEAQALRAMRAPAASVASAYREFLQRAGRRHPAYQEAARYLQNGN